MSLSFPRQPFRSSLPLQDFSNIDGILLWQIELQAEQELCQPDRNHNGSDGDHAGGDHQHRHRIDKIVQQLFSSGDQFFAFVEDEQGDGYALVYEGSDDFYDATKIRSTFKEQEDPNKNDL